MNMVQNSFLNNTSNDYSLQGESNANGFIGTINDLSQVCLAIYDTTNSPYTYTGSENIDITNNQIPLKLPININDEICFHPRNYDGTVFDMLSGTDLVAFSQNSIHGGAPIALFHSSTKECTFLGDCQIPNIHHKTSVDNMASCIYDNIYSKAEIDTLVANIDLSSYYTKTEIDSTCTTSIQLQTDFYSLAKMNLILDTYYTITEIDDIYH